MALQDPEAPVGFDPVIEDALAQQAEPYAPWSWVPDDWNIGAGPGGGPRAPNDQLQHIGGVPGVIETAAAPQFAGSDEIEMPPENMRPATIGQPRAPGVASILGEPAIEQPAGFTPDPESLIHEEQFTQTGMDHPPVPPPAPHYEGAPEIAGIKPERGIGERTLEYLQNPDKLAVEDLNAQQDAANYEREWAEVEGRRNQLRADQNYQLRLDAEKKAAADNEALKADYTRLANTKIDGGRWYRDRSTAGKIGAWVSAIVGGLVAGRTGGPNTGLQAIMKMIDDDVDNQKADIANGMQGLNARRSIIADELARSGDAFRSAEAYRIASYDRVISDIKSQAQQLDPRGARAREYAKLAMNLTAQRNAAEIAAQERNQKFRIGEAELQAKLLANKAAANKLAGVGMGSPKIPRAQIKADYGFDPGRDMTDKELDKLIDRKGKLGTIAGQAADREQKAQDAERKSNELVVGERGQFRNSNGSEFSARSSAEAEKLRKTKSAVDLLAQMRNEIARDIERHGGESNYLKSATWARQKSRYAMSVAGISKALDLGALDDGTTKLAEQLSGDIDPTSFIHDARPGLDQLVNNMAAKFNKDMNVQGYDGPAYAPPNNSKVGTKPTDTTVDKLGKEAQDLTFSERRKAIVNVGQGGVVAKGNEMVGDLSRFESIRGLAFAADNPDPDQRERAMLALEDIAQNGPTDATKEYAAAMLHTLRSAKPGEFAARMVQEGR